MRNFQVSEFLITSVAFALGDLVNEVVYVGGAIAYLLVDAAAAHTARGTEDVDVIINVATLNDYYKFGDRLKARGFREDAESHPPLTCRWRVPIGEQDIIVDVMPLDKSVLNFENIWYRDAIKSPMRVALNNGITINVIDPIYFLATKFEAWKSRGNGDLTEKDIEDIFVVIEGNSQILRLFMDAPAALKKYLSNELSLLVKTPDFMNILPGLLANPSSQNQIANTLRLIAK